MDEYLKDKSKPIWVSLSQGHVELYRWAQGRHWGLQRQAQSPRPLFMPILLWLCTRVHREVQVVYHGNNSELEALLGCSGPFWGRQYFFWHKGRPLTLIYEVFSNKLEQYLGPATSISR